MYQDTGRAGYFCSSKLLLSKQRVGILLVLSNYVLDNCFSPHSFPKKSSHIKIDSWNKFSSNLSSYNFQTRITHPHM